MLRQTRWPLVGVGLLMLVAGGVSIFSRPARELLYDPALPAGACSSLGCVFLYRLEVGNTGREPLEQVLVRLRAPVLATAPIRPSVRDFGKFDRPAEVSEAGGVRTYALGRLNPEDRVDVSFVLRRDARQDLPGWADVLVAVEAPGASVKRGSPGWVMVLRLWYAIVSAF